jgi:aryl-alcohol dehydrogenase-like predicted oxidoreductase
MERYKQSQVKVAVSAYEEVAAKYGVTPAQLALAWCKSRCVTLFVSQLHPSCDSQRDVRCVSRR